MTSIIKRITAAGFGLALVAGLLPVTAGAATPNVADKPAPPATLVQLDSLVVDSVEGIAHVLGGPGTPVPYSGIVARVTASKPSSCKSYDVSSPCPQMLARPYAISVLTSTAVLDRDRRQIVWSDIAPGDRVNVYGRLRVETGEMEAIVLRDVTRPESIQMVQLEQLRVVSYAETVSGYQMLASYGTGPCYAFPAGRKLSMPCPAGSQPADNVRLPEMTAPLRLYAIAVPRSATVLDANRKPIKAGTVRVGDMVNVYGQLTSKAEGRVTASIVRVIARGAAEQLSIDASAPGKLTVGTDARIELAARGGVAPYAWEIAAPPLVSSLQARSKWQLPQALKLVTASTIYCLVAPCPQPDTSVAAIAGVPSEAGSYAVTVRVTDAAGRTVQRVIDIQVGPSAADRDLKVAVSTDKDSYGADETMKVTVSATNVSRSTRTLRFGSSCQASYDVIPGFSLRAVSLCAQGETSVRLRGGETRTWSFEHVFANHQVTDQPYPMRLRVVGHVEGYGSSTREIAVNAFR